MGTIDLEKLLTSAEVCELLNVSRKTLQRYMRDRKINYIRLSSDAYRFRPAAIALFLAGRGISKWPDDVPRPKPKVVKEKVAKEKVAKEKVVKPSMLNRIELLESQMARVVSALIHTGILSPEGDAPSDGPAGSDAPVTSTGT